MSSSARKATYRNALPPLPSDCILPKFEIPRLSTDFDLEAPIHKFAVETFVTDPFLGIPVEFADLAIYSFPPTSEAYREADVLYMPELVDNSQSFSLPNAPTYGRPRTEETAKAKPTADPRTFYVRSPFFETAEDSGIQEQLESAFGGRVPAGKVCLVKKARDLHALQLRGAEQINPTDGRKVLLLTQQKRYIKAVPRPVDGDESEPVMAVRAYHVTEDAVKQRCYIQWDPEREVCWMGKIDKRYALKAMSKKEMEEEEVTATPVLFLKEPESEGVPEVVE
jgi:hypothetical protein